MQTCDTVPAMPNIAHITTTKGSVSISASCSTVGTLTASSSGMSSVATSPNNFAFATTPNTRSNTQSNLDGIAAKVGSDTRSSLSSVTTDASSKKSNVPALQFQNSVIASRTEKI